MQRKKCRYLLVEEAMRQAFDAGLRLGVSMGNLPQRIAPKLADCSDEKKIAKLLDGELEAIFKEFKN
jgi:hypothetical protein